MRISLSAMTPKMPEVRAGGSAALVDDAVTAAGDRHPDPHADPILMLISAGIAALPARVRPGLTRYVEAAVGIAGARLVSLAVFGAVLTPDWRPKLPIQHAIVTADDDLALIADLGRGLRRPAKQAGLAVPLLLTPALIRSSLDTYPLEWLDLGACHAVLAGADPFSDLVCEREPVRLHCEREATALAMALRQRVLHAGGRQVPLGDLAEQAIRVVRGLVHLRGGPVQRAPSGVIGDGGRLLECDLQPLLRAWRGETGTELTDLVHTALTVLGTLSDRA